MNNLLIPVLSILYGLVVASILTFIFSIDAAKGWNKHLVFQDIFFFFVVVMASAMAFRDYSHNSDPVEVAMILVVFYFVICRVPKWGVLK
jgi:hypothetical protein